MDTLDRNVSDLHLAAYLLAAGYRLLSARQGNGSHVTFVFNAVPDSAIGDYFSGRDQTSARAVLNAWRDLRGLLRGMAR